MRPRLGRVLLAASVWLGCASAPRPDAAPLHEVAAGAHLMGTVLELTLFGPDARALDAARIAAFAEVQRIEVLLSRWRGDSEISRLNEAAGQGAVTLEVEVVDLLDRCLDLNRITIGAFDVSVGPVLALWKRAEERGVPPGARQIAAALERVGPEKLSLQEDGRVALAAGSTLDLGAVAKGYALDRVRQSLPASVKAALLNFGQSSTWAVGSPPGEEGWRLLVQSPGGGYAGTIALRDQALSVSAGLGQWREIGGQRYGHLIDPRDGLPLTRRLQALVVSRDATLAEALATALVVLGEESGLELAQSLTGVEALLLDDRGRRWRTEGWDRVTRFRELEGAGP